MANKKNSNKKDGNSNKKIVKKSKKINSNKIESISGYDMNFVRVVRVVGIIAIVFCLFYFLTIWITKQDSSSPVTELEEDIISYTEVLAGRSFSLPEDEYLILYYDFEDENLSSTFSTSLSNYRSGDSSHYTIYTSDLGNVLNKSHVAEVSNKNPSGATDLVISGPTLIHFKEGRVIEYIEGETEISSYLG